MTHMTLQAVRQLIANDSYAITFQSVEQYRSTLLRHVDSLVDGTQQYASGGTVPVELRLAGEGLRPFSAPAAQHAESGAPALPLRTRFESWALSKAWLPEIIAKRDGDGYEDSWLDEYWDCWKACVAQPTNAQTVAASFKEFWKKRVPAGSDSDHAALFAFEVWQAALAAQSQGAQAAAGVERGTDYIMAAVASYADDRSAGTLERIRRMVAEGEHARAAPAAKAEAPAAQQAAAPGALPGYKLVPLEPTPEMQQAGFDTPGAHMYNASYRAMVAAAPSAPGTPEAPADQDAKDAARYRALRNNATPLAVARSMRIEFVNLGPDEPIESRIDSLCDQYIAAQLDGGQGEEGSHECRRAT